MRIGDPSRLAGRVLASCRPTIALLCMTLHSGIAVGQVTTTSDEDPAPPGSLRSELEASVSGATIDFQLDAGGTDESVIQLRTGLLFDNSVTLDNTDAGFAPATLRAPDAGNLIDVAAGVSVTLRDIGLGPNGQNNSDDIDLQAADSMLTFDLSRGDQTVFADIVGLGGVVKEGPFALTLSGEGNDFLGGLTIREGDVIGDGTAFNTSVIDLQANDAGRVARVVYDFSGTDFVDATSPMFVNSSVGGGLAQFVKRGTGSLDIRENADIDSSIGIQIEDGSLIVEGTFISNGHSYEISSGATLTVDAPAVAMLATSSRLSGSGLLRVDTMELTMTGDLSAFSGTADVVAGTFNDVTIAPATAPSGPLTFDIQLESSTSGATLQDDFGIAFTGNVGGSGEFRKEGAGTTEWTGLRSGNFRTIISAGTLNGNTNNLGGTILIADGATLGFRQAFAGTFTGNLINPADPNERYTINQIGPGLLTVATDQNFQGDWNVMEGGLFFAQGVDFTNAASNLTIGTGAGTTRTTLAAAYDPTPGADNTVQIGGNLTIASDARVTVDLDDSGASNVRFAAGGVLDIDPAAELVVRLQPGTYAGAAPMSILTGGSVTGTSDFTIQQSLFFFDILGAVSGNAYQITLSPRAGVSLSDQATTPNQVAVGGQLDLFRTGPSGGDPQIQEIQGALTVLQASEVGGVLDATAADDLAASTNTNLAAAAQTWRSLSNRLALHRHQSIGHHDSREARRAKARRERAARQRDGARRRPRSRPSVDANAAPAERERVPEPWVAWLEGSGTLGEIDAQDEKGYDYRLVGPLVGADSALTPRVRVGAAVGSTYALYETDTAQQSEGDSQTVEGVVYAAWLGEPFEALLAARYAHAWVETERRFDFGGVANRADGEYEGDQFGFYVELTRGFGLPLEIDLAPLASIAYSRFMWEDFDESGASPLRMRVEESDIDTAVTSLGFRIGTTAEMDQGFLFRPRLKAVWNHEWADTERDVTGRFASASVTGGSAFTVEGAEIPRDHAEIALGWEISYGANANLFLDWEGRFGEDLIENSASVGVRVAW